jgi:hypothetical protein
VHQDVVEGYLLDPLLNVVQPAKCEQGFIDTAQKLCEADSVLREFMEI